LQLTLLSPFASAATDRFITQESFAGLDTPFAVACTASPFEAPSPRDMNLYPAEEKLLPDPTLVGCCSAAECDWGEQACSQGEMGRVLPSLWATGERAPWLQVSPHYSMRQTRAILCRLSMCRGMP
jgi:hypothetical protein